ncbi:MAG: succinyl-CoA--3-ketoacid-CoA transferase [Deltaproteobacteria bacterium]|nr:succinyl-CoA--3-ketoacid-CoA transferase [Deltaproteobacteria bacterium]
MKDRLTEELVAMRAAKELKPGDYCNLGFGIPELCASCVADGVVVQSEVGVLGYGPLYDDDEVDQMNPDYIDAGVHFFRYLPGMSFFDLQVSFAMIRSGRLISILGGLQVSEKGDIAVHNKGEEKISYRIGGSVDLAWGAKRLIVAMLHNTKAGVPKVVRDLTIPATARGCVDLIITDLAVMEVTGKGLVLKEVAPGWTPEEVIAETDAGLIVAADVREMEF